VLKANIPWARYIGQILHFEAQLHVVAEWLNNVLNRIFINRNTLFALNRMKCQEKYVWSKGE
jgi:hypothetical protein